MALPRSLSTALEDLWVPKTPSRGKHTRSIDREHDVRVGLSGNMPDERAAFETFETKSIELTKTECVGHWWIGSGVGEHS
jgi:hypothetical protein